ncbi:fungal-specific transcription factor domain-containing protein [Aspergillus pseudoustus]|uniref:Fungal-specific transcription factor domain-containing protein n=1 Tax=Aspergillus pseudoustus TaxID=1810923 RepID=A0ABR4JXP0_9EURO
MEALQTNRRVRNRMACIHCRQMKLKCDGNDKFPASCSRCERAGKACAIDPSFRRMARRQRLERMEREIRDMKQAEASEREQLREPSTTDPADTPRDEGEDLPSLESLMETLSQVDLLQSNQILEDIELSPSVFCELFLLFYRYYHPRFPLLPDLLTLTRNCTSCQLLFWAVVAISSGYAEAHTDLHLSLAGPVRRLAGIEVINTDIASLSLIHALLILCCWPQPFGATASDPSWLYCGSATHMALKMGLHRPGDVGEFVYGVPVNEEQKLIRRKTWVACFIVNQTLSCQLGIPSTMKIDNTILNSLGPWSSPLPLAISDHLQVSYKCFSFSGILGHYEGTPDGLLPNPMPIIESFGADLNALESAKWESWGLTTRLSFLCTKLHLFSYSLTVQNADHHADSPALLPDPRSARYLSEAYITAIRLVETCCGGTLFTNSATTQAITSDEFLPPKVGRCWTIFERSALIYAVLFLLRLTRLTPNNNFPQIRSDNAIRQATTFLRSCSVFKDDHFSRLCDILDYICDTESGGNDGSSPASWLADDLGVRSRMSSNIVFDAILRAKARFHRGHALPYASSTILPVETQLSGQTNGIHPSEGFVASPFGTGLSLDDSLWNVLHFDFMAVMADGPIDQTVPLDA